MLFCRSAEYAFQPSAVFHSEPNQTQAQRGGGGFDFPELARRGLTVLIPEDAKLMCNSICTSKKLAADPNQQRRRCAEPSPWRARPRRISA